MGTAADGGVIGWEPTKGRAVPEQKEPSMRRRDQSEEQRKRELDRKLDKELEDTFPTSDPPSLSQPTPNKPAGDPKAEKHEKGDYDLRDARQGAYDPVGIQKVPDDSTYQTPLLQRQESSKHAPP
jgi:hypothetical protein